MKKKLAAALLCMAITVTTIPAYAGNTTDVSGDALLEVLEKANNLPERSTILKTVENDIKTDGGIDELKDYMVGTLEGNQHYREALEKRNITSKDLENSLENLKDWDVQERKDLIDAVRNDDLKKAQQIIENDGKIPEKHEETTPSAGGGGGGGSTKATKEDTKDKDTNKDEQQVKETTDTKDEASTKENVVEKKEIHFKDIDHSFAKANIEHMACLGIISGMDENTFAPNEKVSRDQMTTLIVKCLSIEPNKEGNIPFEDVAKDHWAYAFIKSAYDAGLIHGTSDNTFEPQDFVTTEQMVVMIMNAFPYKNAQKASQVLDKAQEIDMSQVSDWAKDPMNKAYELSFLHQEGVEKINPKKEATREEVAYMLDQVYEWMHQE